MHFSFWVLELRQNLEGKMFVRDQHLQRVGGGRLSRGRNESASQDQQTLREFGEGSETSIVLGIISIRLVGM